MEIKTEDEYTKGNADNYTHIKFYYAKYTMITNKSTYINYYPREKKIANKFEYLIKVE